MSSRNGAVRQAFCRPYSFVPPCTVGTLVTLHHVGTVTCPPDHYTFHCKQQNLHLIFRNCSLVLLPTLRFLFLYLHPGSKDSFCLDVYIFSGCFIFNLFLCQIRTMPTVKSPFTAYARDTIFDLSDAFSTGFLIMVVF